MSINTRGSWQTPLGTVSIDEMLAAALLQADPELTEDSEAHRGEHSLEVELPFLQYLTEFRFVPLCLSHVSYETCERLGKAIATTVTAQGCI